MTSTGVATRALRRIGMWAVLAVGFSVSTVARAEFNPGWYIGGGVGLYNFTEVDDAVPSQIRGESAIGSQLFGGYQYKYIALETGYWYFNKLSGQSGGVKDQLQMDGWFGRGLLMFPFEFSPTTSIAVFGGGGAQKWHIDATSRDTTANTIIAKDSFSEDGTSVTAGLWIRGRNAATRLAYELFTFKDDDSEISMWSINFIYHF